MAGETGNWSFISSECSFIHIQCITLNLSMMEKYKTF